MEQKLSGVSATMENLKKAAKSPGKGNSGLVHSTPLTQNVSQPGNSEDTLTTRITWSKRIDLESEDEHQNNSVNSDTSKAGEPVSFEKIWITPVLKATEEFLKTAFSPMENGPQRQLWHQFIVPDMPFTTPPHLDKFIVDECASETSLSKSRPIKIWQWCTGN